MGDGLAWLFLLWIRGAPASWRNTSLSHRILPVLASRHTRRSDCSRFCPGTAVVSQIRPPTTTGDDQPRPGMGVFQATFLSLLQVSGRSVTVVTPWPVGPRNWGQS